MKQLIFWLILGSSFFIVQVASAQATTATDSSVALAVAAARRPLGQATQAESRLLSGTEYVNYSRPNSVGHQFFQSAIAQPGSLTYDGFGFGAVPLLYDLKLDQLVMPDPTRGTNLKLLAEKVQTFTINGHQFVRLVAADTTAKAAFPTGFYDLLLPSSERGAALLARRTKREVQEPVAGRLEFQYEEKTRLLIQQSGALTEVDNLKDVLSLLPEHKAELQKFARSNHLKFKGDDRETAIIALLRYYNTLVPAGVAR
jgi:hypothetical protein